MRNDSQRWSACRDRRGKRTRGIDEAKKICEIFLEVCNQAGRDFIFKGSFDKANRSSITSYRGPGLEAGLEMLSDIKNTFQVPVLADVHETGQVDDVCAVVDVIQIPAFFGSPNRLSGRMRKNGNQLM